MDWRDHLHDSLRKDLEALQGGRCAICGERPDQQLILDHDHSSGFVRGLLCKLCNLEEGRACRHCEPGPGECAFCSYRRQPPVTWIGLTLRCRTFLAHIPVELWRDWEPALDRTRREKTARDDAMVRLAAAALPESWLDRLAGKSVAS